MRRSKIVQHYARLATTLGSYPDLQQMMQEVTPRLGFDFFALTHYVSDPLAANVVDLSSFPERWSTTARARGYWRDSPIAAACRRSLSGFAWSEIDKRIALSTRQREILRAARQRGVGDGFTVPANIPAAVSGSISFAMEGDRPLPRDLLHAAQYIACFAYEAGLRISAKGHFPIAPPPNLSTRQVDCVLLVARGKSDWEIGKILGISKETAHKHIQNAMRRLSVNSRTQLVVRALFDSHVTFRDVLS